jgi:energy-coupling factor transporter transmembrane protein EcfT
MRVRTARMASGVCFAVVLFVVGGVCVCALWLVFVVVVDCVRGVYVLPLLSLLPPPPSLLLLLLLFLWLLLLLLPQQQQQQQQEFQFHPVQLQDKHKPESFLQIVQLLLH